MSKPTKQITGILKMLDHNAEMQKRATQRWKNRAQQFEAVGNRALQKVEELQALVKLYEEQEMGVAGECCDREFSLPRVITADELKLGSGQWIAYKSYTHDDLWIAEKYDMDAFSPGYNGTIVLLADAPDTKDLNVAKETVKGEYPDNPWFATVYEDAPYLAGTWRGTPVRPQSIRAGDLYDIHTAHGSRITGVVAARNGVRNPQNGDQYRLVSRAGAA